MSFSSFFEKFPDLVATEFRNIYILDNETTQHIPPGNYAFLESFCEDTDCDCRNVMIHVITTDPVKVWAKLRYGWETKKFYRDWCYGQDNELAQNFPGTCIDFLSPQNPISKEFLSIFTKIIKNDQPYAKRLETHYQMFKEKIDNKPKLKLIKNATYSSASKVGRNDVCPCGSGTKFKKCCFKLIR